MPKQAKSSFEVETRDILHGIDKQLPALQQISLDGVTYSRAELIALFRGALAVAAKTSSARAAWHGALAEEAGMRKQLRLLRNAFRRYVEATFGAASPKLALFGFAAKSPAKPSTMTTLGAVEKRRATRAARGTAGKRQKAKIKGKVE